MRFVFVLVIFVCAFLVGCREGLPAATLVAQITPSSTLTNTLEPTATNMATATQPPSLTPSKTATSTPSPTNTATPTIEPLSIEWNEDVEIVAELSTADVSWSPYNDQLLYVTCQGQEQLWLFEAATKSIVEITVDIVDPAVCDFTGIKTDWGLDDRSIVFSAPPAYGYSDLWLVDINNQIGQQIGDGLRYPALLQRNGASIWYSDYTGNGSIEIVEYDTASNSNTFTIGILGQFEAFNGQFIALSPLTPDEHSIAAVVSYFDTTFEPPSAINYTTLHHFSREEVYEIYSLPLGYRNTRFAGWVAGTNIMLLEAWEEDERTSDGKVQLVEKTVWRWDVETGETMLLAEGGVIALANEDGGLVAVVDSAENPTLKIINSTTGDVTREFLTSGATPYWITDAIIAYPDENSEWQLVDLANDMTNPLTRRGGALLEVLHGSFSGDFLSASECHQEDEEQVCRVYVIENPLRR